MNESTTASRTVFRGRLLQVDVLDVALPGGGKSTRELVRHPGAVAVLPRLADGRFVLVRQFRKAVETVLLEVVAGTLEQGEAPEACARRETHEETGYRVETLTRLGRICPAPGYSTEWLEVYAASVVPAETAARPDDDEQIEAVLLSGAELEAGVAAGEIVDAKTLACWLLFLRQRAAHRARLPEEDGA